MFTARNVTTTYVMLIIILITITITIKYYYAVSITVTITITSTITITIASTYICIYHRPKYDDNVCSELFLSQKHNNIISFCP